LCFTKIEREHNGNWGLNLLFPYDKTQNKHLAVPIKIAIIDSGINNKIVALKGKVKESYNFVDDVTQTNDKFDHGTMVASIISADFNIFTVSGVNPNTHIYDAQVLDENGEGTIENIINGINWAIDKKVDIINISFGIPTRDSLLEKTVDNALSKGIVIVAAAGNNYGMSADYPASFEGVYSISAIDDSLKLYNQAANGKIDFVAPGVDVPVINHDGTLKKVSGTSFATAYATGAISVIMQSKFPTKKNLIEYAEKLGCKEEFGNGLIQIIQ